MIEKDSRFDNIYFLDDNNWQELIDQDKVSILCFLSSADLNSRHEIPYIKEFARKHGESYNIGVIDAGKSPMACHGCQVDFVPSTMILRKGVLIGRRRGCFSVERHERELLARLDEIQALPIEELATV